MTSATNSQPLNDNTVAGPEESAVAEYLANHPDFFHHHPDLLADMSLPHQSGSAISLIERQVAVLRERGQRSRNKLGELIDAAKNNDDLFSKTQSLVLDLLDANSVDEVIQLLEKSLLSDFGVEQANVLLLSEGATRFTANQASLTEARQAISHILDNSRSLCGALRESEYNFLFPNNSSDIGSSAIAHRDITIDEQPAIVLIAAAHHDAEHYDSDTGTLFIDYLCDFLQKLIQKHLSQ